MKLFIQNMVSMRCKMVVQQELEKLGIRFSSIELGEVQLEDSLSEKTKQQLASALHLSGLELMFDKKAILIEKIIHLIIESIRTSKDGCPIKFSVFLSQKLSHNYHYLSELFSKNKGITIEQFIILHKVERIKELIMYNEMNLKEISYIMHYSSVSHLSKQFKKTTGLTPSYFRNLEQKKRSNIEDL